MAFQIPQYASPTKSFRTTTNAVSSWGTDRVISQPRRHTTTSTASDSCTRPSTRVITSPTTHRRSSSAETLTPVLHPSTYEDCVVGPLIRSPGHCLHTLHHSLTCNADMTIRVMKWHPHLLLPSPVDHEHECMNWDSIDAWAKERYVDTATPGLLVHPTKGKYCCMRNEGFWYLMVPIRRSVSWREVYGARRGIRYCLLGPSQQFSPQ